MGRCPICFLQNISLIRLVVLEKKIFEGLPIFGHGGHLEFRIKTILAIFPSPQCLDATYEIWLHLAQWFQRRSRLKVWTDDGRTTEASHTKSSPRAFGSGELKIVSTKCFCINVFFSMSVHRNLMMPPWHHWELIQDGIQDGHQNPQYLLKYVG